jgi:hypothetical protein
MFAVTTANSQTSVEIGLAGDSYWATDNDKSVGLGERKLANTNVFKDRFGINNVLLDANVTSESWRAKFVLANFGEDVIVPEEANIGLHICHGLWVTGGLYANWDNDYTYNKWFTGNSLTDYANMAAPYLAWGLEYAHCEDMTIGVGMLNSGIHSGFEDNNLSKSIYAKFNWNNLYKDWSLVLSGITGNEAESFPNGGQQIHTCIYASITGTIIDKLEAQLMSKLFMLSPEKGDSSLSAMSFQALARYHFTEKIAAGIRFAYADDKDGVMKIKNSGIDLGVVCEYNPTPFTYFRLEGGMLSLSNSDAENAANIFSDGTEKVSSRLGIALSIGFKFGLFEREFGSK